MANIINCDNFTKHVDKYVLYLEFVRNELNSTLDRMFKQMDNNETVDQEEYAISVTVGDKTYELGSCAAEWNGLIEYIDHIINQQ